MYADAEARVVPELEADATQARQMFGLIGAVGAIGVIIMMQSVLVGEKEAGITAWILSKPVSRPSYILSKWLSNTAGVLFTVILAPGVVAYLLFSQMFVGSWLPPVTFVGGLGIVALDVLFYLSLTLMLGAFFNSRGPVLAIPLALVFLQQPLIGLVEPLLNVLPYSLSAVLAGAVAFSAPLPFVAPIIAAVGWIVVFSALAIWRFGHEEF